VKSPRLPVLVAPDSFKGSLPASEVAEHVASGLEQRGRDAVRLPVADGGDGTLDVLLDALGGERVCVRVSDPLGRPIDAELGLLDDGTAVVEAARASGLALVDERERDAWRASTRGTGELIAAAAEAGAREVIVAVGGTATTDGGADAIAALQSVGASPRMRLACDVRTPWERAARVFGPQKGADPETVRRLERRLARLARAAPRDPRGVPLSGCGGGLSGGLWAHFGARLEPGAALVLDMIGFDERMRAARFVVTGEGLIDAQTLAGKAVGEVATRSRQGGVACHAVVGSEDLDRFHERLLDLASVIEAPTPRALVEAGRLLADV